MGHVQSKARKERKRRKITQLSEIMKNMTLSRENIHKVAGHRIYRDSVNVDQLSNSSGYFSSNEPSPQSHGNEENWRCAGNEVEHENYGKFEIHDSEYSGVYGTVSHLEELCTYKGLPLDDHPALTKLQNEQNTRLEHMEKRMSKIKTNAQQAFERKKFAHMFRAKNEDPKTDMLLQEAKGMLQQNVEGRNTLNKTVKNSDNAGEIIPVKIVHDIKDRPEEEDSYFPFATFGSLQISEPVMLLILPFLLPLFIIVAIIRGLSQTFGWKPGPYKPKSRRSS